MKELYNKNPKLCQACEEPIPYAKRRNKYCNHSCAASITNKGNTNNLKGGKWKKKPCEECGEVTDNPKFCSIKCFHLNEQHKMDKMIEAGEYSNPSSGDTPLRKYVIRTRGYKCEECKTEKWRGHKVPLDLHHINGDNQDHKLENVILLCLNCHGITPNFGRKNKK